MMEGARCPLQSSAGCGTVRWAWQQALILGPRALQCGLSRSAILPLCSHLPWSPFSAVLPCAAISPGPPLPSCPVQPSPLVPLLCCPALCSHLPWSPSSAVLPCAAMSPGPPPPSCPVQPSPLAQLPNAHLWIGPVPRPSNNPHLPNDTIRA